MQLPLPEHAFRLRSVRILHRRRRCKLATTLAQRCRRQVGRLLPVVKLPAQCHSRHLLTSSPALPPQCHNDPHSLMGGFLGILRRLALAMISILIRENYSVPLERCHQMLFLPGFSGVNTNQNQRKSRLPNAYVQSRFRAIHAVFITI
eukprot:COSAG02_NODE_391_length_23237_cov_42.467672_6_plen_148_part_00